MLLLEVCQVQLKVHLEGEGQEIHLLVETHSHNNQRHSAVLTEAAMPIHNRLHSVTILVSSKIHQLTVVNPKVATRLPANSLPKELAGMAINAGFHTKASLPVEAAEEALELEMAATTTATLEAAPLVGHADKS